MYLLLLSSRLVKRNFDDAETSSASKNERRCTWSWSFDLTGVNSLKNQKNKRTTRIRLSRGCRSEKFATESCSRAFDRLLPLAFALPTRPPRERSSNCKRSRARRSTRKRAHRYDLRSKFVKFCKKFLKTLRV